MLINIGFFVFVTLYYCVIVFFLIFILKNSWFLVLCMSFYYGVSTFMCLAKCMAVFFAVYLTNLSQNKTNVNPAEQLYFNKDKC